MPQPAAPRHVTSLATAFAILTASAYAGALAQDGPAAASTSHETRPLAQRPSEPNVTTAAASPTAASRPGTAAPLPVVERDAVPVSSLAEDGIPTTALKAYRRAAREANDSFGSCGIVWPLVAAIGRVETDHGRHGGAVLHTDGVSTPGIVGKALDGVGTEVVRDTDHGVLDGDKVYDRAVGPMQFIPSTWTRWGVDADHDGRTDINDVDDAAAATADYLCASGGDLRTYAGQKRAVLTYNHSEEYLETVLGLEKIYAKGVVTVPTAPGKGDAKPRPTPKPALAAAAPRSVPASTTPRGTTPRSSPATSATPKPPKPPRSSCTPRPTPTKSGAPTSTPTRTPSATPSPTRTPTPSTSATPSNSPTPTCR